MALCVREAERWGSWHPYANPRGGGERTPGPETMSFVEGKG